MIIFGGWTKYSTLAGDTANRVTQAWVFQSGYIKAFIQELEYERPRPV